MTPQMLAWQPLVKTKMPTIMVDRFPAHIPQAIATIQPPSTTADSFLVIIHKLAKTKMPTTTGEHFLAHILDPSVWTQAPSTKAEHNLVFI